MVTVENVNNYIRIIGTFDNVAKLFYIPKNTGRFDVVLNENFEIYTGDWENRKHLGNYENISLITRDVLGVAIETPFSSFFEALVTFRESTITSPSVGFTKLLTVLNKVDLKRMFGYGNYGYSSYYNKYPHYWHRGWSSL